MPQPSQIKQVDSLSEMKMVSETASNGAMLFSEGLQAVIDHDEQCV